MSTKSTIRWLLLANIAVLSLSAAAQDALIFRAEFEGAGAGMPPQPESFPFIPNRPFDVIFQCDLSYVDTRTISKLSYFFDFRGNQSLIGQFEVDTGDRINLTGNYTYSLGTIRFDASGTYRSTGLARRVAFALQSQQVMERMGMVGYFAGLGTVSDTAVGLPDAPTPSRMRCLAIGHRYNAQAGFMRFSCPDQPRDLSIYTNTFEFDVNAQLPGSAFRQRDRYVGGAVTGSPERIERSDFGLYRRVGNELYIDFTYLPGEPPRFSDFTTLRGRLVGNDARLQLDEFPADKSSCARQ